MTDTTSAPDGAGAPERPSRGRHAGKRLSPWRVSIAIVVVLVVVAGGIAAASWMLRDNDEPTVATPWFGGYVDVTAAAVEELPTMGDGSTTSLLLSFIVAADSSTCEPSWGAAYDLDEASSSLDLDRRIARARQQGTEIGVSFGGAINDELALVCTSVDDLYQAYDDVVERYDLDVIDLDLENEGLTDTAALERRAAAIAQLQQDRAAAGHPLQVWLTLPVATTGLLDTGKAAVAAMLDAGVDLSGVNVMTMDFGVDLGGMTMAQASEKALTATETQLVALLEERDLNVPSDGAWSMLGATPMIGQNDVSDEVFTLDDATELNAFARAHSLKRMSMWSMNRDRTCGPNYPDVEVVSDSCSGVDQGDSTFAAILAQGFDGQLVSASATPTTVTTATPGATATDDPETSPYPVWSEDDAAYSAGVKVVWHGNVYVAKWWTQGKPEPDDPTLTADQSAWTLVGPVLDTDPPYSLPTLAPGTYPDWSAVTVYQAGDRVLYDGTAFEARWANQAVSPSAGITDHDYATWRMLDSGE